MQYRLLRFALGTTLSVLVSTGARSDLLEGPLAFLLCKNGISTSDFEDLRFPLGQIQLILSKKVHCGPRTGPAGPDQTSWTARFKIAGAETIAGEVTIELGQWVEAAVFVHARTLSIAAIRRELGQDRKEVLKIGVEAGQVVARKIDIPNLADDFHLLAIPYWGADTPDTRISNGTAMRSLSPLLGDVLPLRVIDSPWVEIGEGILLDVRTGAIRRYKSEQAIGLERFRVLGLAPDDRTLLSVAGTEDPRDLRLVLMDTVEDKIQIIPLVSLFPAWNRFPDASAITAPWIYGHFDVLASPDKMLELRPRPARSVAPRRTFVANSHAAVRLASVRPTIMPLIMQALQRDWDATFRESRWMKERRSREDGLVQLWFGTIGRASIALSLNENGIVSFSLLGDKDDNEKDFSRAQNAMVQAIFEAVSEYLNNRLREPEWQAELIEPGDGLPQTPARRGTDVRP